MRISAVCAIPIIAEGASPGNIQAHLFVLTSFPFSEISLLYSHHSKIVVVDTA